MAALAKMADFRQDGLLARIRFYVFAVRTEPEAEADVPDPLPAASLVAQGVPGALSDRLPFPLAHRAHDRNDQPAGCRTGIQRLRHGNQRHFALFEQFQKSAEVLHATRESTSFWR